MLRLALPLAAQDVKLKELWDDHGGASSAAAAIAADMGLPRSVVARRIKALGLKRGVLTEAQVPFVKSVAPYYKPH